MTRKSEGESESKIYKYIQYALEVEYCCGNRDATEVNLFKHLYKISLQQALLFQRDSYDHFVDDEDIVSCEGTLEFFVNSCHGALIKSIEEKYETLDKPEQGGIMYLKIAFDHMFNMRNFFITPLHDFIKNFYKDGISKVPNKFFWI